MAVHELGNYVIGHTERGECKCGQCIDKGDKPEPQGHTADLIFFKVAKRENPTAEEFRRLTLDSLQGAYCNCDPLDGREHSYIELGGWIGDQGVAMQYMALGALLGVFELLTPRTVLGLAESDDSAVKLASQGFLSIRVRREALAGTAA